VYSEILQNVTKLHEATLHSQMHNPTYIHQQEIESTPLLPTAEKPKIMYIHNHPLQFAVNFLQDALHTSSYVARKTLCPLISDTTQQ
jgi:hypothetical protein